MKVEIWSDVVCPWCYVGKRRFEQALAGFPHRDEVEVVWRSFELDPSAPPERTGDYAGHLAGKYGVPLAQAQQMLDTMTATAAQEGLEFSFATARPGSTFDAHRLLHLAADRGVQGAVKERLLRATFTEGEPIGDHDALVRLVAEAGLDADEAREVLASDRYAAEVRGDEQQARAYGITRRAVLRRRRPLRRLGCAAGRGARPGARAGVGRAVTAAGRRRRSRTGLRRRQLRRLGAQPKPPPTRPAAALTAGDDRLVGGRLAARASASSR